MAANTTESQLREQFAKARSTREFATSDSVKAIMRAIDNVAIEPALQLFHALTNNTCTTNAMRMDNNPSRSSSTSSSRWDEDARDGVTYAGIHVEGGLLGQVSFDILGTGWAVTNDYEATFVRACAGVELGGGGDVSLIVGKAMGSATTEEMQSIGLFAGVDVHAIAGTGIDIGILQNQQEVIQVMAGLGAGIGAALQVCATVKVSDGLF